jgi:hypothetical protein
MTGHYHGRSRGGFIEQTVDGLHAVLEGALYADHAASGQGFLQRLDPRVKVLGLTALISISATAARLWVVAAVLALAVILGATSFLPLRGHHFARLYKRRVPRAPRRSGRDTGPCAGPYDSVDARPESPPHVPRARSIHSDSRDDLPVHPPVAGNCARDVRIA